MVAAHFLLRATARDERTAGRPTGGTRRFDMHPLGFLIALMSRQQAAAERARQLPEDPLPPIDDATARAWRAWALGARPTTRPTAAQRPTCGSRLRSHRRDSRRQSRLRSTHRPDDLRSEGRVVRLGGIVDVRLPRPDCPPRGPGRGSSRAARRTCPSGCCTSRHARRPRRDRRAATTCPARPARRPRAPASRRAPRPPGSRSRRPRRRRPSGGSARTGHRRARRRPWPGTRPRAAGSARTGPPCRPRTSAPGREPRRSAARSARGAACRSSSSSCRYRREARWSGASRRRRRRPSRAVRGAPAHGRRLVAEHLLLEAEQHAPDRLPERRLLARGHAAPVPSAAAGASGAGRRMVSAPMPAITASQPANTNAAV